MTRENVDLHASLSQALDGVAGPLGVAVSGGGDSLALLYLLADWAGDAGVELHVVTVDHGLRPEARDEARAVALHAHALGVCHDTLLWQGWDGSGNLQDQARRARYGLIGAWAKEHGIPQVALGHTADDQAETMLMRLARGAGVDGLSGMAVKRRVGPVEFLRPLLSLRREALRDALRSRGVEWVEDPSNTDVRFDRIKARRALENLGDLGVNASSLALVAGNMRQAQEALNWAVLGFSRQNVQVRAGDVIIDRKAFLTLPRELARRLLVHVLNWLAGAEYAPRGRAVVGMIEAAASGTPAVLQGCRMVIRKGGLHFFRELNAVAKVRSAPDGLWDGRWRLTGPAQPGQWIAALGHEGLAHCPDWRACGRPAAAVAAGPAVWSDQGLVAAPLAGVSAGWRAELAPEHEDFLSGLS
ncbi:tRNA lysidine(34) synthetase TilS [Thalassovita taeanensis]|uniref:tRNA(Ile)-lysidine synthase n=1 Tax=Thalassovita taeanensis TaxID=657014 RepID=A0A1H9ACX6_9RHOB|nr:tRNA lysidine(34) synthetase TilS [Thalassovita taeanensis]SEP74391.1 tRNA(Ile)-lysidine synthase [Thalassovita taeanensis]